jgi:hypothetical protein
LEGHISLPLIAMLILLVPEMVLVLLLLLLLFILVPDLLLQDNAIHTSLEKRANSRSLAFQEPETIERHGSRRARKIGEFIGELCIT